LAVAYAIPISLSLFHGRAEVKHAQWNCGRVVGTFVNVLALAWIAFELVLFSMPTALPATAVSMNYASVVFVGFMAISAVWYLVYARKREYKLLFGFSFLPGRLLIGLQIIMVLLSRMRWVQSRFGTYSSISISCFGVMT
jgi:hypothetical protein